MRKDRPAFNKKNKKEKMEEKCYHLYYEGVVQGVGFRYTARYLASTHNIKGWVRNLPDGRVEMCVQAKVSSLDVFLCAIRGSFRSYITNVVSEETPLQHELRDFQIKFHSF